MVNTLTQDDIDIFGTDPSTVKEKPGVTDYSDGVEVRYTAPAKWWNWLWNALTGWLTHHKADYQSIITEETNLLSAAELTPDSSSAHQVTQSFEDIAENYSEEYDVETVLEEGNEHYVNRPYVDGLAIVLPDTELL